MITLWNRVRRMLGLSYKIVAPPIPANEIMHLRAHVDECGPCGPDYSVSVDYECKWDEISASEMEALRKHIDEAKNDPDYAVIYTPQPEE
jgi:hypothetical protein